jgi:hypothetical protein
LSLSRVTIYYLISFKFFGGLPDLNLKALLGNLTGLSKKSAIKFVKIIGHYIDLDPETRPTTESLVSSFEELNSNK